MCVAVCSVNNAPTCCDGGQTKEHLEFMSLCLRDRPSIVEFAFVQWTGLLEPNLLFLLPNSLLFHLLVCLLLMGICLPGLACFGAGLVCIRSFLARLFASLPVSATLRIIPLHVVRLPSPSPPWGRAISRCTTPHLPSAVAWLG